MVLVMRWLIPLLLVGMLPGVGLAQTRCRRPERARELFEAARVQAAASRMDDARVLYRQSQRLCPRVPTAYNLAVTLLSLGEIGEALALLEPLADGELGELGPEQRSAVVRLREEARASRATIVVQLEGAERATLRVGGRDAVEVAAGREHSIQVDPGRHLVHARAEDGRETEAEAEVRRGERRALRLTLPAPAGEPVGLLQLTASDADAVLEIVGVAVGRGSLERRLRPDRYLVRGLGQENAVDLDAGETLRIHFDPLPTSGGDALSWLWIALGVVVIGAAVTTAVLLGQPNAETDPVWGRVTP